MKIRNAKKEDFPMLFELWKEAGLTLLPFDEEKRVTTNTILYNPSSCLVLVTKDDEIIGSILGAFNGRVGSINRLAIKPEFQKKGFGLLLLSKVEQILKKKGVRKTVLEIETSHLGILDFYKKHGYEDVRDQYILLKKKL